MIPPQDTNLFRLNLTQSVQGIGIPHQRLCNLSGLVGAEPVIVMLEDQQHAAIRVQPNADLRDGRAVRHIGDGEVRRERSIGHDRDYQMRYGDGEIRIGGDVAYGFVGLSGEYGDPYGEYGL